MKYEKVLVLGGTGFLGKNLQKVKPEWIYAGRTYFVQDGIKCEYYPIDEVRYDRPGEVRELIDQFNPDAVVNLSADVGGITYNEKNQLSIYENNIVINTNIIKACRELEIDRVLSCLSTCAWPNFRDNGPPGMTEKQLFCAITYDIIDWEPYEGHRAYGWSKRMLQLHTELARDAGYNYSTFAPSNLYGPHDHMGEDSSHFVASLIHKVSSLVKPPNDHYIEWLEMLGDGKALRQFLFAPDLAQIIPLLLEEHNNGTPIIVAPDENLSIDEMVKKALTSVNKTPLVRYSGESKGQFNKQCSNKMLKELIGDFEFTKFEDGFKQTYDWYMENK